MVDLRFTKYPYFKERGLSRQFIVLVGLYYTVVYAPMAAFLLPLDSILFRPQKSCERKYFNCSLLNRRRKDLRLCRSHIRRRCFCFETALSALADLKQFLLNNRIPALPPLGDFGAGTR